jgi:5-methylcytosine-specific restriction endonuclease McrA
MDNKLTYGELLKLPEWKSKRDEVLNRDRYICQKCNNKKYYDTFLKGIFIDFLNPQVDGTPIFFLNVRANYFLTRKTALELNIRQHSVIFFKEDEGKLYIYASRGLDQKEIYRLLDWRERNQLSFVDGVKTSGAEELPLEIITESTWTFIRDLHVHHTYYQTNLLPWEYPNNTLQTLCWSCHSEVHENTDIPVYDRTKNLIGYFDGCHRCSGAGYIPIYKHVQNGICFGCGGQGYLTSSFIRKERKNTNDNFDF